MSIPQLVSAPTLFMSRPIAEWVSSTSVKHFECWQRHYELDVWFCMTFASPSTISSSTSSLRIAWDLVHHSGESSAGEDGHTLQLIDVAMGWSERVMLLGCGYQAM